MNNGKKETAINLLKLGVDKKIIIKSTGLSPKELETLNNKLEKEL